MQPPAAATRILGIDPGLRLTGFGVVQCQGTLISYVASGVIRVPDGELARRLAVIFSRVSELIQTYSPTHAAIEKVFVNVNPASTLLLGQARGAALTALAMAALPIVEYTPLQIKQSVTGTGRASKAQVQAMITRLLALPGVPGKDAADALACAVCHAHGEPAARAIGGLAPGLARRGLRLRRGRLVQS